MDNIAIALLVVVLAVQVYVSFFKSAGPVGDDKSSALLLEDLRRQLGEANALTALGAQQGLAESGQWANSAMVMGWMRIPRADQEAVYGQIRHNPTAASCGF